MADIRKRWLFIAIASGIGVIGLYIFAVLTLWGQQLDNSWALAWQEQESTATSITGVLHIINPLTLVGMLVVIVLVGASRGELRLGIIATVGMAGAVLTAELMKTLLPRPDLAPETNALIGSVESLPSGHVTIVMAFTLALYAVSAPCCRRTVLIVGIIVTTIIGTSVILAGWHRPSDVLAGVLLAIGWCALAHLVAVSSNRTSIDSDENVGKG